MHPAIRIVIFLVFLGVLAHAQILVTLSIFILVLLFFPRYWHQALTMAWRFWWRLRWLLLSITVLYLVVTPGEPLWHNLGGWAPSKQGLMIVVQRLLGWAVIMYLFALFSLVTTATQWQSGLYWLLTVVTRSSAGLQRLTLRMTLTMQAVTELQHNLRTQKPLDATLPKYRIVERLAALLIQMRQQAQTMPVHAVTLEELVAPHWYEWSYPIFLILALLGFQLLLQSIKLF